MKKIISVLVLGCASFQPLYADELSDAIAKYQQACDKGDASSCNELGTTYDKYGKYAEAEPLYTSRGQVFGFFSKQLKS